MQHIIISVFYFIYCCCYVLLCVICYTCNIFVVCFHEKMVMFRVSCSWRRQLDRRILPECRCPAPADFRVSVINCSQAVAAIASQQATLPGKSSCPAAGLPLSPAEVRIHAGMGAIWRSLPAPSPSRRDLPRWRVQRLCHSAPDFYG